MNLSFLDYLRRGELPPIVFSTPRAEVLRLLGTPTSWAGKDDPLFQPPRRDFHTSGSISFGSLTFSFDAGDRVESIMLCHAFECAYPSGSLFFPESATTIQDVAELMQGYDIPFEDTSTEGDSSQLRTASGVVMATNFAQDGEGRILSCHSQRARSVPRLD
jgi:hypothetical protein